MIKGVLFDFNGTLFFDTKYHIKSWKEYAKKAFDVTLTDEEFLENVHGRANSYIVPYLSRGKITSKEEIDAHIVKKCEVYKSLVRKDLATIKLVDGFVECCEFLKTHNIPFNICTASRVYNVDFYYEIFPELENYIPRSKIVFDDGTIKNGKPAPDFYFKGADSIERDIKDCIVLEDSYSGLKSGLASSCYKVIAVRNSENDEEIERLQIENVISNLYELIDFIKKENNIKD